MDNIEDIKIAHKKELRIKHNKNYYEKHKKKKAISSKLLFEFKK